MTPDQGILARDRARALLNFQAMIPSRVPPLTVALLFVSLTISNVALASSACRDLLSRQEQQIDELAGILRKKSKTSGSIEIVLERDVKQRFNLLAEQIGRLELKRRLNKKLKDQVSEAQAKKPETKIDRKNLLPPRMEKPLVKWTFDLDQIPIDSARANQSLADSKIPSFTGVSGDGTWAIVGTQSGGVVVHHLPTGSTRIIQERTGSGPEFFISPSQNALVTFDRVRKFKTFHLNSDGTVSVKKEQDLVSTIRDRSWSPDGKILYLTTKDGGVGALNTVTADLSMIAQNKGAVNWVKLSSTHAGGIAENGSASTLQVLDLRTGTPHDFGPAGGTNAYPRYVGSHFAVFGPGLTVANFATGKTHSLEGDWNLVSVSPDEQRLAIGGIPPGKSASVQILDLPSWLTVGKPFEVPFLYTRDESLAFNRDGSLLFVATPNEKHMAGNGQLTIFETIEGTKIADVPIVARKLLNMDVFKTSNGVALHGEYGSQIVDISQLANFSHEDALAGADISASPTGNVVIARHRDTDALNLTSIASRQTVPLEDLHWHSWYMRERIAWDPKGRFLLAADERGKVQILEFRWKETSDVSN